MKGRCRPLLLFYTSQRQPVPENQSLSNRAGKAACPIKTLTKTSGWAVKGTRLNEVLPNVPPSNVLQDYALPAPSTFVRRKHT